MKTALLALGVILLIAPRTFSDSVLLNSGELIRGDILSESTTDLVIMVVNANRTITSRRTVLISDVKLVDRETPQQKLERKAYEALEDRLRLDPNRELSTNEYDSGIAALNDYLATYPTSKFAGDARSLLSMWKDELSQVENGKVKFGNRWMTADEKKPLVEKLLQQQRVQKLAATIKDLQNEARNYDNRRNELNGAMASSQQAIANLSRNPSRSPGGAARVDVQSISALQQRVSQIQQELGTVNNAARVARQKLAQAESDYQVASTAAQQPVMVAKTVQPAAAQPTAVTQEIAAASVEPAVQQTLAAPAKPWIVRNWKVLAVIGGVLAILGGLTPLLLRKLETAQQKRDRTRRVAHEQLKKLFDQIFLQGERPSGKNTPEGEIVPFGNGHVGGERWFVVGPEYVWAVQNNARDDDNWVLNNVETGGPGAIGARVAADAEVVQSIKILSQAGR